MRKQIIIYAGKLNIKNNGLVIIGWCLPSDTLLPVTRSDLRSITKNVQVV